MWNELSLVVFLPLDLDRVDCFDLSVFVTLKMGCGREISSWVVTKLSGSFLPVVEAIDFGPLSPRFIRGALLRRSSLDKIGRSDDSSLSSFLTSLSSVVEHR